MTLAEERLTRYESLFDFTARGICDHLENDQPDADRITDALIYLKEELHKVTEKIVQEG